MNFRIEKAHLNDDDLYQIYILNKLAFSEKYLAAYEALKEIYYFSPGMFYVIRHKGSSSVIGYMTMVPLTYDAYTRIKNGEIDKDVISTENIVTCEPKYVYWDAIVIHPNYRKFHLSTTLLSYVFKDVFANNPGIERVLACTVSKGGFKLGMKKGLVPKYNLDQQTVIIEKVLNRQPERRKKLYEDNRNKKNKREVLRTMRSLQDN